MMKFTDRLDEAIKVAALAHEKQGQHRKGSDVPYIVHPFGVMLIAATVTDDEDTLIACLLHDILEDVDSGIYSAENMRADFGEPVLDIVLDVTKDDNIKDWRRRSLAYLDHLQNKASQPAVIVSAADKTHNLMSVLSDYQAIGDEVWQKFTTKSAADQLWWYQSALAVIKKRLPGSLLSARLEELVNQLKALAF